MTTPQPAALPELPPLPRCNYPNMQYQRRYVGNLYTADQMRAYALTALQSQQSTQGDTPAAAGVSDEFLYELWDQQYRSWIGGEQFEYIARAILALRPQSAVAKAQVPKS